MAVSQIGGNSSYVNNLLNTDNSSNNTFNASSGDNPLATGLKSLGTGNKGLADNLGNIIDPNQASGDSSGQNAPIFKTPEKFSYDVGSDPQYQSALNLARQNIQTDQGNTLANLVSHGQGNSSYSAGAVAQVANKAMGNLNNNLLPQFIKEAYNRYQDNIKNNYQTQLANYNASQDQIKNNQWNKTYDAGRTDAGNNLAISKGTLTGDYTDPGMAALQKQMQDNSAKWQDNPNNDPEIAKQNDALHNTNLNLAKQLGQTYDPNTGEYTGGKTSTRTVAGQTLDQNIAKENAILTGHMPDGTPTSAQQQLDLANEWKASESTGVVSAKLAQLYNIPAGTPTQAAKQFAQSLNIQQQNANNSATATSNAFTLGNRNADIAQEHANLAKSKQEYDQNPKSPDNVYKLSQAARDNALAIKAGNDSQKNAIDTAYKDAASLAMKDLINWSRADTPEKQAALIDQYYQKLKPAPAAGVSDSDISSYLNKK